MSHSRNRLAPGPLLLALLLSGCVTLERSFPDKRYFALEIGREIGPAQAPSRGVLRIANVRVSPRYEGKHFVYRLSDSSYEADFYNEFLVAPAGLLAEELAKGLARSQLFQYVIEPASQLAPTHFLETNVSALYGDFRDRDAPKAILEMEFFLSKESAGKSAIVWQKRYAKAVALPRRSPDALVKGWDEGLAALLIDLIADLQAANL